MRACVLVCLFVCLFAEQACDSECVCGCKPTFFSHIYTQQITFVHLNVAEALVADPCITLLSCFFCLKKGEKNNGDKLKKLT